jgi:hypothetical protein
MLKKITPTLITSGSSQINVKWAYDVTNDYKTQTYRIDSVGASYFGEALFYSTEATEDDAAKYTSGGDKVSIKRVNTSGSGNLISVGLESTIQGTPLSIQEFNIQATIGRIY